MLFLDRFYIYTASYERCLHIQPTPRLGKLFGLDKGSKDSLTSIVSELGKEKKKLKKTLWGLIWLLFFPFMAYPAQADITWNTYDQFDGTIIDESKWILETEGSGGVWPYLADGRLVLEASALPFREADSEIHPTSPSSYTGIMADLHFATYEPYASQYFEAAMEMKVDFGNDYAATFEIRAQSSSSLVGTAFIEYNPDAPHPQLPQQSIAADWGQIHSVGIAVDENDILFLLDGNVVWVCDAEIYDPAFADATIEILTSGGEVTGYVDNVKLATTVSIAGACMLQDGSCVETTQQGCADAGGAYQGDGTECTAAENWTQVNVDGFGDANNEAVLFAEYDNVLYVGTANLVTGLEVWRYDGMTWAQVCTHGFGDANNIWPTGQAVYNNSLYMVAENEVTGCEVWQYDGITWSQVNSDGFGDARNTLATLEVYNDFLYAATGNLNTGCEVWQYDGTAWTQVNTDGFGEVINEDAYQEVYANFLHVAVDNGCDPISGGTQVWRYDGATWTKENTNGFGDSNNEQAGLVVCDNLLYAGVNNHLGAQVWQYDGTTWSQVSTGGFGDGNNKEANLLAAYSGGLYVGTDNDIAGCEIWRYDDTTWTQVNTDGFGDANNSEGRPSVHNATLYVGTTNEVTGAEVWRYTADMAGPSMLTTTPSDGVTDASVNTVITATFSEAMDSSTINTNTFLVNDGSENIVGTVAYGDKTATFTPATSLTYNITYTATITTGAEDLAGNALESSYAWSFTTEDEPDTTPPTVSSTTPTDDATDISVHTAITAVFSEAMNSSTINDATFLVNDGAANIAGMVSCDDMIATFIPATSLGCDITYTAIITTGAQDLAGNGLENDYAWSFTTQAIQDTTPPTVSSTSPADGATDVSVNGVINASFSEAINSSTINVDTFLVNDGSGDIAGTLIYDGAAATFTPDTSLACNATYTVTITTGVEDLAGNPLQNDNAWSFTTETEPDITPPEVTSTSPPDAAINVSVSMPITVTFSEAMDASTINASTFFVNDGSAGIAGTITYNDMTATFTPSHSLSLDMTYTATITTGAEDLAGNPIQSEYQWLFLTESKPGEPILTLDHFPLDEGSEWVYSVSPPSVTFEYEGETVNLTFGDVSVSIPSEGRIVTEMPFDGTVSGVKFSGNGRSEVEYVVDSGLIKLASEEISASVRAPGYKESITYSQLATYSLPLTVLEHGMGIGDDISNSGTAQVDWALDYVHGGQHDTDSGSDESFVSVTTSVVGEEEILFEGKSLDTLEARMNTVLNGSSSQITMNLARFLGPVKQDSSIPGLENVFGDIGTVSKILESTNLPVWESTTSYAVDSNTGAALDFDINGGDAAISIPAGCLSNSTSLTVGDISNIPDSRGINGIAWAVGIDIDDPSVVLNCPMTLTLPYTQADLDDARVKDPSKLKVYRWGSPSSGWEALPITAVDTNNQTVSVEVSQLSVFGLGARASGGGGGGCFIGTVRNRL